MSGDLARLRSVPSTFEGEIIRSRLEAEGIPVLLKGGSSSDPYPTGPVHVFVPAGLEVQAQLALSDVPGGDVPASADEVDPT
ncbi:MAG TPA: hypothetical protein VJ913_06990 [Actinomycetota bacterium]|nr:hypothetical protein [Actinomycetota bacterium]